MASQVGFLVCNVAREAVGWAADRAPGLHLLAAAHLCEREAWVRTWATKRSLEAAVVAPCGDPCWERLATALSALGPFSVHRAETVGPDLRRFEALAWGKIRRAHISSPIPPEGVKHSFPLDTGLLSRRDLLKFPARRRAIPLPIFEASTCLGRRGCGRCVDACPVRALMVEGGVPAVSRSRCEGCGYCVTACPTGALRLPGFSFAEILSEIRGVLSIPGGPRVALFDCRAGPPDRVPPETFRIALPCVGMLSLQWLLTPLVEGAAGVVVLESSGRCHRWHDGARARLMVSIARLILPGLCLEEERVSAFGSSSSLGAAARRLATLPRLEGDPPGSLADSARDLPDVLRKLAWLGGGSPGPVSGEALPFGTAVVDRARCSLCGACAAACAREALSLSENEREAALTFDAASCDGCQLCESHCPESALAIRRELRVEHLGERRLLHRGKMARCLGCGAMLASANLLRALRARLQGSAGVALGLQYCPACRMAGDPRGRAQGPPGRGGPALADASGCPPV